MSGWFVPEDRASPARIQVRGAATVFDIEPTLRSDIVEAGLHNNGFVGFHVDEAQIPNLSRMSELELRDRDTQLLIYKRFNPALHFSRKLFLFDDGAIPRSHLLEALGSRFSMSYGQVERYSPETLFSLLNITYNPSLFLKGRLPFLLHEPSLRNQAFVVAAILRNPVEELAERLTLLKLYALGKLSPALSQRLDELKSLAPLIEKFFLDDPRTIGSALKNIAFEHRRTLRSPLTRMYACTDDRNVSRNDVTLALENLSTVDAVGVHSRMPQFLGTLEGVLGGEIPPSSDSNPFKLIGALTDALTDLDIVSDLLEYDLALYSYVEAAVHEVG